MKTKNNNLSRLLVLASAALCCFDTAQAQSNILIANPQQLTFNTQPGVAPTPQILLIQSSGGPVNAFVSASSENNWLIVNAASGVTPLPITVFVGAGAPASGTDVGFINVTSAGASVTVPVVLNANSAGGASRITLNPNSLSFTFPANSTTPLTQTVAVSSDTANVSAFTAKAVINNGGGWMNVNPTGGLVPGSFQVTVNPGLLPTAGLFTAAVAISAPGTTGVSLPVLVTLAGIPAVNLNVTQLAYAWQIGTGVPPAQTLTLTSSTGANVGFTATARTSTCGNNWIVLSQQSGATPSSISVQVNTSGLNPGQCTGQIDISAPGASNPNISIPVSLLVTVNPLILVPSTGPTFTYQLGSSTQPAAQNVPVNSSSSSLSFTATVTPSNAGPNFLQLSAAAGVTPLPLTLSINSSVLPAIGPGTYTSTVTIASAGAGNSPQSFPVTLVVNSNPLLTATSQGLSFNYQVGQTPPQTQTFTVSSSGAPLNFQVAVSATSCAGFLVAAPSNGSTTPPSNQVVVGVNITGITPQVCNGSITLTVPGSTTPPLVIPVTLNVSATPLLNVSQSSLGVTALVGAGATTQSISVTSTDPNTQLPFTATAATNPIGLTWLAVAPNTGNTPSNLLVVINPINLAAGTYTGSITVNSTAPNNPAQTIPVTLVVASSTVAANPATLTFTQPAGSGAPPGQTVQISGVPGGTTLGQVVTMLNGGGWLQATVSGNALTVTANGSQLPQGAYAGVVTVIVPGAVNSPLNIPVTLNVGAPLTISVSPNTVNFTYQTGGTIPAAQTVQVQSNGSAPFTAVFTSTRGGAFATVTPASGGTPGTLSIALNQAVLSTLTAGIYNGTVTVSSANIAGGSQAVAVNLTVMGAAPPVVAQILSAATLQSGPISPGELVAIKGIGVGPATPPQGIIGQPTAAGLLPTTLGTVTVTFNNIPAPLLYVSANQVNAIVPYEIAGQASANVVLQFGTLSSFPIPMRVVDTTPAIFTQDASGNGQGSILNQDFSVNSVNRPAAKGSIIAIYGTGEGVTTPPMPSGGFTPGVAPFPRPVANVSVTIGGQPAQIFYSGEAPTLVSGVIQVNAMIPANIASGNQPVVMTIGSTSTAQQNVTVAVQ